ncbi:hypothetical protein BGZ80_008150, partial [Entomortierella chlamydospora]
SALTALGIVSRNDYGKGIHNLGVKTNIKVIRLVDNKEPSTAAKVRKLICAYLEHTTVSKKQLAMGVEWSIESYADAYDVFVNMRQQAAETTNSATPSFSDLQLRKIKVQRLYAERRHAEYKARKARRAAQSSDVSQSKPTNPFLAIDKPNSTQLQTHRPRYTPKVRYEPIEKQAPPQIYLQHSLKAWKQPPEREETTLKDPAPKKPPAPIRPKLEEGVLPGRKDIK